MIHLLFVLAVASASGSDVAKAVLVALILWALAYVWAYAVVQVTGH